MEKKTLRVRKNMDDEVELIDLFPDYDRANCGNPLCDRQITSISKTLTWIADNPEKPEDGVLTCGKCGDFHGESMESWLNGDYIWML